MDQEKKEKLIKAAKVVIDIFKDKEAARVIVGAVSTIIPAVNFKMSVDVPGFRKSIDVGSKNIITNKYDKKESH